MMAVIAASCIVTTYSSNNGRFKLLYNPQNSINADELEGL
jgi:hypothetical protein